MVARRSFHSGLGGAFALGVALALLTLAAAFALYKPLRVAAPTWGPVTCISTTICVDDLNFADEAKALYAQGLEITTRNVAAPETLPRSIFCTTRKCAKYFSNAAPAAFNVATVGFVLNPKGLTTHFVAHEMIHHVQNERLGSLTAWIKPVWWREGMAYSLSEDPRRPIPGDGTLEGYRAQFETWYRQINKAQLWQQSSAL